MRRVIILGLVALTVIVFYYIWIPCNDITVYTVPFPEDPLRSIIFHVESSASSALNIHQSCAVESAARHHLYSSVKVLVLSPTEDTFSLTHSLSNVELIEISYENIFKGTPLEQWYLRERWKNKSYFTNYINDIIRFVFVWKFGGMYLDTDVIVLEPLLRYLEDFVVKENDSSITAAVFGFGEKHPFASLCLDYLEDIYRMNNPGRVSGIVITRALMDFCQINTFEKVREKHCKIYTLPSSALFPVPNKKCLDYFTASRLPYMLMIRTYTNFSDKLRIPIGSGTELEEAMRTNCPIVYHHIARNSDYL